MSTKAGSIAAFAVMGVLAGACRGEGTEVNAPPTGDGVAAAPAPAAPTTETAATATSAPPGSSAAQGAGQAPAANPQSPASPRVFGFDTDRPGSPPGGFSFGRTGGGKPGKWVVTEEAGAPSGPHVLGQLDPDATDARFPVATVDGLLLRDFQLSVRCQPMAGRVDQACGLIFRYRDENNYYVTRANALENNVRLYHVKDGRRKQFSSWSGPVTPKAWHELRVQAREDHFEVFWDGQKVLNAQDGTFPDPGKIGLWTKADSVTYFDDLTVTPL